MSKTLLSSITSITGIVVTGITTLAMNTPAQAILNSQPSAILSELSVKISDFDNIPQLIAQTQGKTGPQTTTTSSAAAIALAKHLTEQKAVLYVAYWCPHCHRQKQLFGREAVSSLTIVECAPGGVNPQPQLCQDKGVTGYPSWEINGKMYAGTRTLRQLARLSNYQGNRNF